jgi:hypothetical protein
MLACGLVPVVLVALGAVIVCGFWVLVGPGLPAGMPVMPGCEALGDVVNGLDGAPVLEFI